MEKYDAIFLGGGPTSTSVFDHYAKKMGLHSQSILLLENESVEGAITKGVKVINSITPKLPRIKTGNIKEYREIAALVASSEIQLVKFFGRTEPFSGTYEMGVRCCISDEEYEILELVKGSCTADNRSKIDVTAEFLKKTCGDGFDPGKIFPYRERLWDVSSYQDIMVSNINKRLIRAVGKVCYSHSTGEGIILKVMQMDGTRQDICTSQLFVCKGIGNIDFEKGVKEKESSSLNTLKFGVLPYYKRIYQPKTGMPNFLSSVFIPSKGICITNEQNSLLSLLHDTNASFCLPDNFDILASEKDLPEARNRLLAKMPPLPDHYEKEFICPMTLDLAAYQGNPEKHFEFILSPSVKENIHYLNLPYFTVIGTALQKLPKKLNDF